MVLTNGIAIKRHVAIRVFFDGLYDIIIHYWSIENGM